MADWLYAVVDVSDNSTTVYADPCRLRGIIVETGLSAHACPVKDGSTTVGNIPASAVVGQWFDFFDMRMETSLVIDPNDSGTGSLTVVYSPIHSGESV